MKRPVAIAFLGLGVLITGAVTVIALDVPERASTEVITDEELAAARSSYDDLQADDRALVNGFLTSLADNGHVIAVSDLTVAEMTLDSSTGGKGLIAWDADVAIDSIAITSTQSLRSKRFSVEIELERNVESAELECVLMAVASRWSSDSYHRLSMCAQDTHGTESATGTATLVDYSELRWEPDHADDATVTGLQISAAAGNPDEHGIWISTQTPEVGAEFKTPGEACGGTPDRTAYVAETRTAAGFVVPNRYCFPIETLDFFSTQRSSYGVGAAGSFAYTDPVWLAAVGEYAYTGQLENLPSLHVSISAEARVSII